MTRLMEVATIGGLLFLTVTATISRDYGYGTKFHRLQDQLEELIYKNREAQVRLVIDHVKFMEGLTPEQELMLHMPDTWLRDELSEEETEDEEPGNQNSPFYESFLE